MTMPGKGGITLLAVALVNPLGLQGQQEAQAHPTDRSLSAVAVRVSQAPEIDGVMDEAFWESIPPITDFRQRVPVDGGPPSERTEDRDALARRRVAERARPGTDRVDQKTELTGARQAQAHRPGQQTLTGAEHEELARLPRIDASASDPQ